MAPEPRHLRAARLGYGVGSDSDSSLLTHLVPVRSLTGACKRNPLVLHIHTASEALVLASTERSLAPDLMASGVDADARHQRISACSR